MESRTNQLFDAVRTLLHTSTRKPQDIHNKIDEVFSLLENAENAVAHDALLIRDNSVGKRNFGEYLARWMGTEYISRYLQLLSKVYVEDKNMRSKLASPFKGGEKSNWNLSTTIARFQNDKTIIEYIKFLEKVANKYQLAFVSKPITKSGIASFTDLLARFPKGSAVRVEYDRFVKQLILMGKENISSLYPESLGNFDQLNKVTKKTLTPLVNDFKQLLALVAPKLQRRSYLAKDLNIQDIRKIDSIDKILAALTAKRFKAGIDFINEKTTSLTMLIGLNADEKAIKKLLDILTRLARISGKNSEVILNLFRQKDRHNRNLARLMVSRHDSGITHHLLDLLNHLADHTEYGKSDIAGILNIQSINHSKYKNGKNNEFTTALSIAYKGSKCDNLKMIALLDKCLGNEKITLSKNTVFQLLDYGIKGANKYKLGDMLALYQDAEVFFQFIKLTDRLSTQGSLRRKVLQLLPKNYELFQDEKTKEVILSEIAKLPINERIQLYKSAKAPLTPLGYILRLQRGYTECKEGHGSLWIAERMLDKAYDVKTAANTTENNGHRVLFNAVNEHDTMLVKRLIFNGANVNVRRKETHTTPTHSATAKGYAMVLRELLAGGAKVNAVTKNSHTPLYYAISKDEYACAKLLLEFEADPNIATANGRSLLFLASKKNNLYSVELLLKHGANPDIGIQPDYSPLFIACQHGYIKLVELLLKYNADISLTFKTNYKRLTSFNTNKSKDVQDRLCEFMNRQPDTNNIEMTPADIAYVMGHKEISRLLKQHTIESTKALPTNEITPPSYEESVIESTREYIALVEKKMKIKGPLSSSEATKKYIDALTKYPLYPNAKTKESLDATYPVIVKKQTLIEHLQKIYETQVEKEKDENTLDILKKAPLVPTRKISQQNLFSKKEPVKVAVVEEKRKVGDLMSF